jgi:hypothetical protein
MPNETRRRRRRSTFGSSSAGTIAEGLPLDAAYDAEVSDLDTDTPINEQVSALATAPRPRDEFTPSGRMREVGDRASKYEKEYRLKLLHRLLLRGIALDVIAQELNVSIDTVLRNRRELYHMLRQQASQLDANSLVGETIGFYAETQAMSLKMASGEKTPQNIKLAAIRTALSSRNDRHRFYQASGVFDVLQYTSAEDSSTSDLDLLMKLTERLIESDDITDDMAEREGVDADDVLIAGLEHENELDIHLF